MHTPTPIANDTQILAISCTTGIIPHTGEQLDKLSGLCPVCALVASVRESTSLPGFGIILFLWCIISLITPSQQPVSADPLPTPVPYLIPSDTPPITPTQTFARLLPSHPGWSDVQDIPKFMTLPFPPDPQIQLLQGWYYDSGGLHSGIDYFRWDANDGFTGFPIIAVADGYACGEWDPTMINAPTYGGCVAGYGHRVLIQHRIRGETYYTYYGHLETISPDIPLGDRSETVYVERGQFIGYAGNTGTSGSAIHLHFGIFTAALGWLDPYDIRLKHHHYPQPNNPGDVRSGINDFWTTNPPSYPDRYDFASRSYLRPGLEEYWTPEFPGYTPEEPIEWSPPGSVTTPQHNTLLTGTVTVAGWVHPQDNETINKIEIWLDGQLYRTAAYGLPRQDANTTDGFRWDWDTTQTSNGMHTLHVRAVSTDGKRTMLPVQHANQSKKLIVNVQNPHGIIDSIQPHTTISNTHIVSGWVKTGGSSLEAIEIWIDDTRRGTATYTTTTPHTSTSYHWTWDTRTERNGPHTIRVRMVTQDGATAWLKPSDEETAENIVVEVKNRLTLPIGKWSVR